jgi:hypothetical protein
VRFKSRRNFSIITPLFSDCTLEMVQRRTSGLCHQHFSRIQTRHLVISTLSGSLQGYPKMDNFKLAAGLGRRWRCQSWLAGEADGQPAPPTIEMVPTTVAAAADRAGGWRLRASGWRWAGGQRRLGGRAAAGVQPLSQQKCGRRSDTGGRACVLGIPLTYDNPNPTVVV